MRGESPQHQRLKHYKQIFNSTNSFEVSGYLELSFFLYVVALSYVIRVFHVVVLLLPILGRTNIFQSERTEKNSKQKMLVYLFHLHFSLAFSDLCSLYFMRIVFVFVHT